MDDGTTKAVHEGMIEGGIDIPEISDDSEQGELQRLFAKAKAFCKDLRYEEAILCYGAVLETDPNNRIALSKKATCYLSLGRGEDAYHCYRAVHLLEPGDAVPLLNMAQSLLLADRIADAIDCYDKASALRPGDSGLLISKGILLLEIGMIEQGFGSFEKAIRKSDRSDSFNGLYLSGEHHQKALEILDNLARSPTASEEIALNARNAIRLIKNMRNLPVE